MSFSQLLQRAPFYSPAKGSPPRYRRPNEPAPLASLLQAHRIPGRPLVNPYEALSASDFDSFVDSVSGKITSALTYDAKAQASKKRGYLDDEEYWMEMGGKPGEFLGGQMQMSNDEEQSQDNPRQDGQLLLDQLYEIPQDQATTDPARERLYPDLNGLEDEQDTANAPSPEDPEDAQPTFHRASSVFDEYLRNLQDGQLETEGQTEEVETEIEEYQEDEDDLGVLPELNGEASDAMPIDSLLDAATNDTVEEAMLESEEITEDICHDLQAIQQAEDEEEQLDLELEEELGLQHDIGTSASEHVQRPESQAKLSPETRSASQVIELDLTSSEEEIEGPADQEEEEDAEEEEEQEEEEELPAFVPARPQVGRKTVPQAVSAAIASTSALKEPIPSQARLLKERTRMRLDNEAKTASGYESDEESEGYPDEDEDKEQSAAEEEEEEEQMLDPDAEDEEAEMREYRKMRRKMKRQNKTIREQDIEDAYFDDESEGGEEDSQDREEGSGKGEDDEGQSSRHRNEEGYDTTSSHGTAASDRNKKKWDEEMEDELEDDDVAQQDRAQSGTLDERVPIPAFFKKQKGTNEYELISGSSEEDEESEEGTESGSEEVSGEQEQSQGGQEGHDSTQGPESAEDDDIQIIEQDNLGEVLEYAIQEAFGQTAAQADAIALQHPGSTIEIDNSIEFIGESLPPTSVSPSAGQTGMAAPQSEATKSAAPISLPQEFGTPAEASALEAALDASAGVLNDEVDALLNEVLRGVDVPMTTLDPSQVFQDASYLVPSSLSAPPTNGLSQTATEDSTLSDNPLGTFLTEMEPLQQDDVPYQVDISDNIASEPVSSTHLQHGTSDDEQYQIDSQPLQDVAMTSDEVETALEGQHEGITAESGSKGPMLSIAQAEQAAKASAPQKSPSASQEMEPVKEQSQRMPSALPEKETIPLDNRRGDITIVSDEEVDERTPSPPPMQDVGMTGDEMETIMETQHADLEETLSVPQQPELPMPSKQPLQFTELDYIPLDNEEEDELPASATETQPGSSVAAREESISDESGGPAVAIDEILDDAVSQEMAEETTIHPDPVAHQAAISHPDSSIPLEKSIETSSRPADTDAAVEATHEEILAWPAAQAATLAAGDEDSETAEIGERDVKHAEAPSPPNEMLEDGHTEAIIEAPAEPSSPIAEATPTRAFNAIKPGLWDPSTPIRFGGRSLEAAVREAAHDPERIHSLRESMGLDQDDAVKAAESFRTQKQAEQEAVEEEEVAVEVKSEQRAPDYVPLDPVTYIESDDEDMEDTSELPTNSPIEESEDSEPGDAVAETLAEETSIHPDPVVSLQGQEGDLSLASAQYISSDDEHDDSLVAQLPSPRNKGSNTDQAVQQPNMTSIAAFPTMNEADEEEEQSSPGQPAVDSHERPGSPSSPSRAIFKQPAVTPKPGRRRKRTSIVTIPVKDDSEESQTSDTNATEDLQVQSILTKPSRPRPHRHGRRASSVTRRSADRVLGTAPAPVHPDAEQYRVESQDASGSYSSPHQTRSQCTYHKLSIPSQSLHTTPGRRLSSRLAQAAESRSSTHVPSDYIFLVPGCATGDRKDKMQEVGMLDLGEASVEEEGHAVKLQSDDDDEISVEGIPSSIIQSLIRVVGIDIFRKGECEILAPIVRVEGEPSRQGTPSEKKRKRESETGTSPSKRSHVTR